MKVVKKETPKEKAKVTNLFGDEYTPDEEEFKIILEGCPAEEVEDLKEDVLWLAEDILEHDKILDLYAERIYSVEEACFWADWEGGLKKCVEELKDAQLQDVENLSSVIDIIKCIQECDKMTVDIDKAQNDTIEILNLENKKLYNSVIYLTIWSFVLTILAIITWFNVFF